MTDLRYVSTRQVAQALGVSVSTVKRWVDEAVLPAHRTAGGHRKILAADVVRLVRESNLPCVDLALLRIPPTGEAPDPGTLSEMFYQALRAGDTAAAAGHLSASREGGMRVETLADAVVAPAMHRLGRDWASGAIDVYQEHLGTHVCLSALKKFQADLPAPDPGAPLAVGGCPEHDHYRVASLLAGMVLTENGWRVINLSAHTPLPSLARAIRELRPRLVWLSVSHLANPQEFLEQYRDLYATAEQHGVAVAVGGQGLNEGIRTRMGYTMFGDGMAQLAAFARSLAPSRGVPRRGRPPAGEEEDDDTRNPQADL